MICKKCGSQLPEETKVCPNCGSTLEVEQAPTEVTSNTNDTELSADEMKKKKYFIWGIYFFALMGLLRFFNNGGFSASFLWWIALAALLFIAFLAFGATDGKAKSDLSASKVMLGASVALYFLIYVFVSPNSSEGSGSPSEVANNEHATTAPRHQEKGERKVCYRCNGIGVCGVCNGRGVVPGNMGLSCETCYGKGDCPTCDGKGYTVVTVH